MEQRDSLLEKIIQRETLYHGSYLDLEKLKVELPDGRQCDREIVRAPDAVAILPVTPEGNVVLVRQHRPAIDRTILEIPAGIVNKKESLESAVIRECEEETGYKPKNVRCLLTYAHAVGYSTGYVTLFLSDELEHTGNAQRDSTEFLEIVSMPFKTLQEMVRTNQVVDSKTILSTLLYAKEKEQVCE